MTKTTVEQKRMFVRSQKTQGRSFSIAEYDRASLANHCLGIDEDDAGDELDVQRPRKRGDCSVRPCPWVGCRHHLAIEVSHIGSLKVNRHLELDQLEETCSLDVAERGGTKLREVGEILNMTRERVRQIETRALIKVAAIARSFGIREDSLPFVEHEPGGEP